MKNKRQTYHCKYQNIAFIVSAILHVIILCSINFLPNSQEEKGVVIRLSVYENKTYQPILQNSSRAVEKKRQLKKDASTTLGTSMAAFSPTRIDSLLLTTFLFQNNDSINTGVLVSQETNKAFYDSLRLEIQNNPVFRTLILNKALLNAHNSVNVIFLSKEDVSLDVDLIVSQEEMRKIEYSINRNSFKMYTPGPNIPQASVFAIPVAAYNLLDKIGVIKMLR